MRALNFMKIDYIKIKQQAYLFPVFWIIAACFAFSNRTFDSGTSLIGAFSYMMFFSLIFCTAPFGFGERKEAGFLILLPSKTCHKVMGRFLFGLSLLGISVVIMGVFLLIKKGLGEISAMTFPICLIMISVTIVILAFEFAFFYLVGENMGAQLLSIVRIAPGMALFFAMSYFINALTKEPEAGSGMVEILNWILERLDAIGWCSLAVAVAALLASMAVCVRVAEKRDYS